MELLKNTVYMESVRRVAELPLDWGRLSGSSFLITGATGMIGSFLTDVLMYRNLHSSMQCIVIAVGRNEQKARSRFADYWDSGWFQYVCRDINDTASFSGIKPGYIFHAASTTHPRAYATEPIQTITANVIGTKNMLDLAAASGTSRFVFASSVEIYGENRGEAERFDESYCGYIDCNTLRAGYPEGKRTGEALCQAYIREKGIDVVIPRLSRIYGPTMLQSDSKALSQFIKKGAAGEDIVLKSEGTQYYSYCHAADAVSGILYCLFAGECGQAYNIADEKSDIRLRDLAGIIAGYAGRQVVFEIPDAVETAGYSKATKALLDSSRLKKLGWRPYFDIETGLRDTLDILRS